MGPVLGSAAVVACLLCGQAAGAPQGAYLIHYEPGPDGKEVKTMEVTYTRK